MIQIQIMIYIRIIKRFENDNYSIFYLLSKHLMHNYNSIVDRSEFVYYSYYIDINGKIAAHKSATGLDPKSGLNKCNS